ncbi:MAG TPA: hypothetical protein VGV61_01415 [Thermoanaerobaculia bacterium]|jgi:hypothetical protein|nr:hypothetical protein [Thermoanaerobaculia bacterium]
MKRSHHQWLARARAAGLGLTAGLTFAMASSAQAPPGAIDSVASVRGTYDTWLLSPLGPLPDESILWLSGQPANRIDVGLAADADIDALEWISPTEIWFSVKDWTTVPFRRTRIAVHPADIMSWDGAAYNRVFNATLCGIAPGANADAVAALPNPFFGGTNVYISFDTTQLIQSQTVFDDEMAIFNTGNGCTLLGKTAPAGIDRRLDLNAFSWVRRWGATFDLLGYGGFDTWGLVGNQLAAPAILLQYRLQGGAWEGARLDPAVGFLPRGELEDVSVQASGMFYDGFETADTSRWSATSP